MTVSPDIFSSHKTRKSNLINRPRIVNPSFVAIPITLPRNGLIGSISVCDSSLYDVPSLFMLYHCFTLKHAFNRPARAGQPHFREIGISARLLYKIINNFQGFVLVHSLHWRELILQGFSRWNAAFIGTSSTKPFELTENLARPCWWPVSSIHSNHAVSVRPEVLNRKVGLGPGNDSHARRTEFR